MQLQEKIIRSQKDIITRLAECEKAISSLYSLYAKTFPHMEPFWTRLAKCEDAHAKLLSSLTRQLDKGIIFQNIGRFDAKSMTAFLEQVQQAIEKASDGTLPVEQAIDTALAIESSVLDAHFYDIVKSDSQEYRIIADRLSSETHEHVKTVQKQLVQIQTDEKPGSTGPR